MKQQQQMEHVVDMLMMDPLQQKWREWDACLILGEALQTQIDA